MKDEEREKAMTALLTGIGNGEIGETMMSRALRDPKGEISSIINRMRPNRETPPEEEPTNNPNEEETPPSE